MRSRPHPLRSSRFAAIERALAGLLAVLVVLGAALDLHHQATTRHVRCAAHGAMVHGSAGVVDLAATGDAVGIALRAPGAELHQQPGSSQHRDHQHCAFPCAASASTVEPPPVSAVVVEVALPRVVVANDVAVTLGRGLYRSAPKTSPPA